MQRLRTITLASLLLGIACTPATSQLRSSSDPSYRPRRDPELCDIDRGRYCAPSTASPIEVKAPGAALNPDEGWVCCAPQGTPCVAVSTYDECTFVGGWCYNYSVNEDDTVTCHD